MVFKGGVIRPPAEIRAVADKTALYVAKNGRAFETRIVNSAQGKMPKFAFLQTNNPFHAYYEERVQFYQAGGKDDDENGDENNENDKKKQDNDDDDKNKDQKPPAKQQATTTTAKTARVVVDPIAKALLEQRNKIEKMSSSKGNNDDDDKEAKENKPSVSQQQRLPPPPPLQFVHLVAPSSLTLPQLEIIQLVAQLTALDTTGQFLSQITLREWNNPSFGFCQPRHGHFAYFTALVDSYRTVLTLLTGSAPSLQDQLNKMANNLPHCLQVAAYHAEYQRHVEQSQAKGGSAGAAGLEPGAALAAPVDWHDFVVVETIDFAVDEVVVELPPPPPSSSTLKTTATTMNPLQNSSLGDNTATPTADMAGAEPEGMEESDDDNDHDDDEPEEAIRVVPSYTPKLASTQKPSTTVIDPISGKSVPAEHMPEHMRIQLLDPKWAEERKRFQEKQRESNLVSGDVVASNLARFNQARGDSFRKKEQDLLSTETDPNKRLEEANRIIRQSNTTVGPTLPPPPGKATGGQRRPNMPLPPLAPNQTDVSEPAAKRPRLQMPPPAVPASASIQAGVPPPPPPPPTAQMKTAPPLATAAAVAPSEDPFAAGATGGIAATTAAAPANAEAGGSELMSEEAFIETLSKPEVTLQIRIPNDPTQMAWNFYGQIVSLSVNVRSTVKAAKEQASQAHLNGLPANKIQLKNTATGAFLKDPMSLAALNIGPVATLELKHKARGGRKG